MHIEVNMHKYATKGEKVAFFKGEHLFFSFWAFLALLRFWLLFASFGLLQSFLCQVMRFCSFSSFWSLGCASFLQTKIFVL